MKMFKLMAKVLFALFIGVVLIIGTYIFWERSRDPVEALPQTSPIGELVLYESWSDTRPDPSRTYKRLAMLSTRGDTIRAVISFPSDYQNRKLPVVTILGGVGIGKENFRYIPDPGNNILVIYEYPHSVVHWKRHADLQGVWRIRKGILHVPAQVLDLNRWLKNQGWTDTTRMPMLGYSFGAFYLPAIYHLADRHEIDLHSGVLAYGGADLELLLRQNLKLQSALFREVAAWLLVTPIHCIDPIHHAPYMNKEYLLINGIHDENIPPASWKLLHTLIPGPKKIELLQTGHMDPQKPDLTCRLVRMSKRWLVEKDLLNK